MSGTEPLDHMAEARKVATEISNNPHATRAEFLAEAQLHAVLAVAEQQKRIADWLEDWPLGSRGEPMTGSWND